MLTKELIDKFYADVDSLGLKFPGATIAGEIKMSKGLVSEVLNKNREPSKKMIDKFYNKFAASLQKVSRETIPANIAMQPQAGSHVLSAAGLNITLADYIALLHRENDRLFTLLNSRLKEIGDDTRTTVAYHKAWAEYEADKVSGGDAKKKKEVARRISKLVDDRLQGGREGGNPGTPAD